MGSIKVSLNETQYLMLRWSEEKEDETCEGTTITWKSRLFYRLRVFILFYFIYTTI